MGLRRDGREAAVQYLFAHEVHEPSGTKSADEIIAFWELHSARPPVKKFADELIGGVLAHIEQIDGYISEACTNFHISRIASVDRNILRLAIYELLHKPTLDAPVIINEAVEIAKKYGSPESRSFVNGIVDRVARQVRTQLRRPSRTDAAPAPKPQDAADAAGTDQD
jgi:N utilization substance protein B